MRRSASPADKGRRRQAARVERGRQIAIFSQLSRPVFAERKIFTWSSGLTENLSFAATPVAARALVVDSRTTTGKRDRHVLTQMADS
jgi:hypothetical protein